MESKALLEAQYANRMTPAREWRLREAAAEASETMVRVRDRARNARGKITLRGPASACPACIQGATLIHAHEVSE